MIKKTDREREHMELAQQRARDQRKEERRLAQEERRYHVFWALVTVGALLLIAFMVAFALVFR